MKILIFTEGTILKHVSEDQMDNFETYIPIDNAVEKIESWKSQVVEICYLTSRKTEKEINDIRGVLMKYNFPKGKLYFRKNGEEYKDVAERVIPDILIEDDCESIGGTPEMTYPHIKEELKLKMKSIPVKEFGGIDHLSSDINQL